MPTPDTDQGKFEALDAKHPLYERMASEWERYRDVVDGITNADKYLERSADEPQEVYDLRKSLSEFTPESPLAVDHIETAIFAQEPRRPPGKLAKIKTFIANTDLRGNDLTHVNVDVLRTLVTFGTTRTLVNTTRKRDDMSVADEQAAQVQPYIINYTPLHTPNWAVDHLGRLLWIVIRDDYSIQEGPFDPRIKMVRFTLWTRVDWTQWEFSIVGEKVKLVSTSNGAHNLGMVPMVCEPLRGRDAMCGSSFVKFMSRVDVRKFRRESDLAYDEHLHAHPTLVLMTMREAAIVGIGANAVLELEPGANESANYLIPPTSGFDALRKSIDNDCRTIRRYSQTDPLGVMEPGSATFQASGVARAWSFSESEDRLLNDIATCMERIETAEIEIALRWETEQRQFAADEKLFDAQISYPREFNRAAAQTLIEEISITKDEIPSESFNKHLMKRYVARRAEDVSQDEITTWEKEIEAADVGPKPLPSGPFGVFGGAPSVGEGPEEDEEETTESEEGPRSVAARKSARENRRTPA